MQCCTVTPLFDLLSRVTHVSTQDAVLSIPGRPEWDRAESAFDGADQSHGERMWIARVALFSKQLSSSRAGKSADTLYACPCESAPRFYSTRKSHAPYTPYTLN